MPKNFKDNQYSISIDDLLQDVSTLPEDMIIAVGLEGVKVSVSDAKRYFFERKYLHHLIIEYSSEGPATIYSEIDSKLSWTMYPTCKLYRLVLMRVVLREYDWKLEINRLDSILDGQVDKLFSKFPPLELFDDPITTRYAIRSTLRWMSNLKNDLQANLSSIEELGHSQRMPFADVFILVKILSVIQSEGSNLSNFSNQIAIRLIEEIDKSMKYFNELDWKDDSTYKTELLPQISFDRVNSEVINYAIRVICDSLTLNTDQTELQPDVDELLEIFKRLPIRRLPERHLEIEVSLGDDERGFSRSCIIGINMRGVPFVCMDCMHNDDEMSYDYDPLDYEQPVRLMFWSSERGVYFLRRKEDVLEPLGRIKRLFDDFLEVLHNETTDRKRLNHSYEFTD